MVFACKAPVPTPTLYEPVVLLCNAPYTPDELSYPPRAVLFVPVVFDLRAKAPKAVPVPVVFVY